MNNIIKKNRHNRHNRQLLNINTIFDSNANIYKYKNLHNNIATPEIDIRTHDIEQLNSIIKDNMTQKYRIIKYLGNGIQGSLYLAIDKNNNKIICKKINISTNTNTSTSTNNNNNNNYITGNMINTGTQLLQTFHTNSDLEKKNQIEFELSVLKYLSSNINTRDYINPCLDYKILNNTIYTFFPVFNGYSLAHFTKYLLKLQHNEYYKLTFYLIKLILHGMANIHKTHIAHQNINENSILVSSNISPDNLFIKFTDFGLGCGNSSNTTSRALNNQNNRYNKLLSCKINNNVPIIISDSIIKQLSESEYLQISQNYDLLSLGIVFLKLLLFFDKLDIDITKGYNNVFANKIKKYLFTKYLPQKNKHTQTQLRTIPQTQHLSPAHIRLTKTPGIANIPKQTHKYINLSHLNVSDDIKKDIIKYITFFTKYIFCKSNDRQTCQYVLDKIIIYEKYKNDTF